jgi:RNA polymerase sigma-70 factor (ECF subfamily)
MAGVIREAVRVVIITQIQPDVGIIVAPSTHFETRLSEMRAWLILLARLHLDYRFRDCEASDIAQETMVDAIKYRDGIEALKSADLEHWLRRVLRNKVVDFYRRQRPHITEADLHRIEADIGDSFLRLETMVVDCQSSPSAQAVKQEDQLRLAEAIEQLSEPNREVIVLKDLAGWTLKQIADAQGCSIGTVAGRLRRGRDQLVQIMRGHHDPTTRRG